MTALGFVVLARRPNPTWVDYDDGHAGGYPHQCTRYTYEIVKMRDGTNMAVATLEGAQNVLEAMQKRNANRSINDDLDDMDVEYVIGEIRGVEQQ